MKIYTKTGDAGTTALYGGERVPKASLRVAAYGTIDELNAVLGLVRAHLDDGELDGHLARLQNTLFDAGADLATPHESRYRENISAIDEGDVAHVEQLIDHYDKDLEPLRNFIMPGGHIAAAALHQARAVARRAEREVVTLKAQEAVNEQVLVYLNRLSDLLFVLARVVNMRKGVRETSWHVKKRRSD